MSVGTIYKTVEAFDKALITLLKVGANQISARDLAYARIEKGTYDCLSTSGTHLREGIVYIPDRTVFMRQSLLANPTVAHRAAQSHSDGQEFYLTDTLVHKCIEQAEKEKHESLNRREYLLLSKRTIFNIPTNRFGSDELSLWLFKDQAQRYGDYLSANGINEMPIYLSENNVRKYANQIWCWDLVSRSGIDGTCHFLDCNFNLFGIKC